MEEENQLTENNQKLDEPKKGLSSVATILIVLVAAIIAAGSVWAYYQYKVLPDLESESETTTPKNETANWKTYMDKKYNYSFKYPTDWILTIEQASADAYVDLGIYSQRPREGFKEYYPVFIHIIDKSELVEENIAKYPQELDKWSIQQLKEYVESTPMVFGIEQGTKSEEIDVNGIKTLKFSGIEQNLNDPVSKGKYTSTMWFIPVANKNIIVKFEYPFGASSLKIAKDPQNIQKADQIVKSFKLVTAEEADRQINFSPTEVVENFYYDGGVSRGSYDPTKSITPSLNQIINKDLNYDLCIDSGYPFSSITVKEQSKSQNEAVVIATMKLDPYSSIKGKESTVTLKLIDNEWKIDSISCRELKD